MKTIQERFFNDPEWHLVEALILEYIEPLKDMSTVDVNQPAEHVKAEIIGRNYAYDSLYRFLEQSKLVGSSKPPIIKSPFR